MAIVTDSAVNNGRMALRSFRPMNDALAQSLWLNEHVGPERRAALGICNVGQALPVV